MAIEANIAARSDHLLRGVLLVLAPLASLSLAGQEHGRTIPLTEVANKKGQMTKQIQVVLVETILLLVVVVPIPEKPRDRR
jgi:hypothetical protein